MEFTYNNTAKKIGWNFSNLKITKEVPSNYNYYKECVSNINNTTIMLDIGCGSCEKSLRYFSQAEKVIAIDNEQEMLNKAKLNAKKYYGENFNKFEFVIGDKNNLNFENETFDLVVSRHCGANMNDVFRVLKKGGIFISEDIDNDDCIELKKLFNRGQNFKSKIIEKQNVINECIKSNFSKLELLNFEEIEYYNSIEDLEFLLLNTPIINGYNKANDFELLKEYVNKNITEKGIKLVRKLYAFKLTK